MDQGTVVYILAQTQHQTMSRKLPGTHCPAMSCDVLIAVGITNGLLMLDRLEPMGYDEQHLQSSRQNSQPSKLIARSFLSFESKPFRLKLSRFCL